MPEEAVIAAMTTENVKVDKLAKEFLLAQSLKILPQTAFGDAVGQFVEKDDKYAVEQFVNETLTLQIQGILAFEAQSDDEDIDPFMEQIRQKQEEAFASGVLKRPKRRGKLRPRPDTWDSDQQGEWEDAPGAFDPGDEEDGAGSDDNASINSAAVASKRPPVTKPAAKRAPAKAKAPPKAKAPAKAKAPTKAPTRGRKKVVASEPSDDEDMDDDVVMFDEAPPPAKSQPKRAAASKGRQTQLSFSQPAKTQASVELSDDEISDEEDAFEPMQSSSKRR
jgi:double-strand break repair protein MRE11